MTHGFAGYNGNWMWFNTGGSVLLLTVETKDDARSIKLNPGFGFCLGKQAKYARVFLSSFDCAGELFNDSESTPTSHQAMFFGCIGGDLDNWRWALNSKDPAQEYRGHNLPNKVGRPDAKLDKRFRRLGVELQNNRRAHIRIAPMKGSDMPKSFLSQKIEAVRNLIKNAISQAKFIEGKFQGETFSESFIETFSGSFIKLNLEVSC